MFWGDYCHKNQVEECICVFFRFVYLCIYSFYLLYTTVCFPSPKQCISYAHGMIYPICDENAIKHQPTTKVKQGVTWRSSEA